MKKLKVILLGVAIVVALGIVLELLLQPDMEKIISQYDETLVEYEKTGDYKSAYYELNHTYNRIAEAGVTFFDRKLYDTEMIGLIGKELSKREEYLLPKLAEAFPEGIEHDWTSTEELRNRYSCFFQTRIASLNKDKATGKMTELATQLRGITKPSPPLPEDPSERVKSAPPPESKEAQLRQQKACDQALEEMKKNN